jgi:PHD/YefM family antitoxin component YafN of YafNO toxin-antitoxin module
VQIELILKSAVPWEYNGVSEVAATIMQKVPSNDAQNQFVFVMDQVCSGLGPVLITGTTGNAVLVSEDQWRAMESRLRQHSIPGIHESVGNGVAEPRHKRGGENTV